MSDAEIGDWEFRNEPPTQGEVVKLLADLPDVWGVPTIGFVDYVQALPRSKKIKNRVELPNGNSRVEETYLDIWNLYMGVAGRVKMAEAAASLNGWCMSFVPEPVTPTGIPGVLSVDPLVYREYVEIWEKTPENVLEADGVPIGPAGGFLGRKPGTSQAGGVVGKTNPFEKAETSARGRALAAWGFGVLPGSGIASLEEVQGARESEASVDQPEPARARRARPVLEESVRTISEEIRQLRGQTEDEMLAKMAQYAQKTFGVDITEKVNDGGEVLSVDLSRLKDGQVALTENALKQSLVTIKAEGASI